MDFESLGKYTHAVEAANKRATELDAKLKELTNELNRTHSERVAKFLGPVFDVVKLRENFEEAATLSAHLDEACREANLHAHKCGKPAFKE